MLEAVEAALRNLNRYPDPAKSALRQRISERTGVPAGRIAIGNGSCEMLLAAADAMLEPGAEIVYAWPSFSIYPHMAAMSGARAVTVPLNDAGEHDLEAMAREVTAATRIVIVCNPNNPSATALPPDAIDAFVAELPRHVAVILDEAYVEFSTLQDPDDSLDLLERHPNLVLLRTFSKVYGLCGLRVGYALGSSVPPGGRPVRQPFSVNALAQAAATEALNHLDEVERRVEQTVIERVHVESELAERGLETTESQANFSWVVARRPRRGRDRERPGRARRDRARGQGARRGGALPGDLRHARGERPLPGGAGRAAVGGPGTHPDAAAHRPGCSRAEPASSCRSLACCSSRPVRGGVRAARTCRAAGETGATSRGIRTSSCSAWR